MQKVLVGPPSLPRGFISNVQSIELRVSRFHSYCFDFGGYNSGAPNEVGKYIYLGHF